MVSPDLARLVEGNAWTYGPVATSLRILRVTAERCADPAGFWEPLLEQCPRMTPLGYWQPALRSGWTPAHVEEDCRRRAALAAERLEACLGGARRVAIVGHDVEIDALWDRDRADREWRYLLLDGGPGSEGPGAFTRRRYRPGRVRLAPPFGFAELEDAFDWADALILAGFPIHRQNLLGPPQLRPVLSGARDQVDVVLLATINERRLTLGEGAPRTYREDFRPYLWQSGVTHLVSEWHRGDEGTILGWLPFPPEVLRQRFGEEFQF